MSGAKPLYIAAAFILEEGLSTDDLYRVVNSMSAAAKEADVLLVTVTPRSLTEAKATSFLSLRQDWALLIIACKSPLITPARETKFF